MLLLQHQILSLKTPKWFYFSIFVASFAKNGSPDDVSQRCVPPSDVSQRRVPPGVPKIYCGDF